MLITLLQRIVELLTAAKLLPPLFLFFLLFCFRCAIMSLSGVINYVFAFIFAVLSPVSVIGQG